MAASAFCGVITVPAHAQTPSIAAPCEKTALKTTGPAWLHLKLTFDKLVSVRNFGPKFAPKQLPIDDVVEFDGYLPADGTDIRIGSGRSVGFVPQLVFENVPGQTPKPSTVEGSKIEGLYGTFHALPSPDGKIVVTPALTLVSGLALEKSGQGDAGVDLPRYRTVHIDTPIVVEGFRCEAHAELTGTSAGKLKGWVPGNYSLRISAYRTQ
ncbi:hypothetical protein [Asaia bogorensis]|uniref:hypothetical protein n=1 Tax=Asaia bogorensis TaxID=91915 RepID=UPI001C9984A7|nr:hypothetical protein [Asaia bogorensis]